MTVKASDDELKKVLKAEFKRQVDHYFEKYDFNEDLMASTTLDRKKFHKFLSADDGFEKLFAKFGDVFSRLGEEASHFLTIPAI
jgi:hypothetical protein